MHRLAAAALAALLAGPAAAAPLILEPGMTEPRTVDPEEQVRLIRPSTAGPYRDRVVLDLDRDEDIHDLGPLGSGKDGVALLGFATLDAKSPWEWFQSADLNRDGVLDESDGGIHQVRIWIDADKDLVPKANEIRAALELGVHKLILPHRGTDVGSWEDAEGRVYRAGIRAY
jgi:hypothetical protein